MSSRRRNLLDQILVSSETCLCIVDARRRIRFFSPGMETWTGWPASKIEGLSCDGLSSEKSSSVDLLAAAFNPSAKTWKGQPQVWLAVLPTATDSVVRASFCAIPLSNSSGQVERVLMVRSDGMLDAGVTPDHSVGQQLHAEVAALRADFRNRFDWDSFIGADDSLRSVRQLADLLKNSNCCFNITGASGTGRQHLARCIHVRGRDTESSFVPISCDLLSTDVLYDTLREIRRLASGHAGSHEHPGLLLLVEVDKIAREVQQWLLEQRPLEDSVRLAATSSVPLARVVAEGWMLPEFQQLIAPVEVSLPPLRDRGRDVLLLAHEFIQRNRRHNRTSATELSADVAAQLQAYHWPGNVRELQQMIYDACQSCDGDVLDTADLPFAFRAGMDAQALTPATARPFQSLDELLQGAEQKIIEATLAACGGNKAEAARRLGMTRPSFYRRIKNLDIGVEPAAPEQPDA